MQPTPEAIFQAALLLPESERLTLVARLLDTVPAQTAAMCVDDPSLGDELDRRFADGEGGIAWHDLRAEG